MRNTSLLTLLIVLLISANEINSQTSAERLAFFHPFTNQVWTGHYSNPEDSHYVHQLEFESILGGSAVILTKKVEELEFEMRTIFFWNPEFEQIAFQSITSKGQISSGFVSLENDQILLTGENINEKSKGTFKQSFQLLANNEITDRFYLMIDNEWKQRHLIIYGK